ncbi:MAG: VWA domain-containing protein [Planctomycetes bacterium]|nr:VWA domain-containing protein [Planctomycetota bacterium]
MRHTVLPWSFAALCSLPLHAQEPLAEGSPQQATAIAQALDAWVADYEKGELAAKNTIRRGDHLQPTYVAHARRAGKLGEHDEERITHLDALQKLLFHAEKHPSAALAEAVLGVAAIGFETSFLDVQAHELRELGHWTLMRMDHQGAWFVVLRTAAGERVPVLDDLRREGGADAEPDADVVVGPSRRVAALQLLGRKNWAVFRSTLEAALVDPEPRVRLAAAEALQPPWRLDTLRRASRALANERHPVVSQALVRGVLAMLQAPPPGLEVAERSIVVDGMLGRFGRCGWRTDMELLDVVELYPTKDMVPLLIGALDLEIKSPDALVTAINKRASPLLREKAASLLRAMTGAILLGDDPKEWRDFWATEHDKVVVPTVLKRARAERTQAQFFGVPVTGGSVAFLVDTSGSMKDAPAGAAVTGVRASAAKSRLAAAKEQILVAASAMDPEAQFWLFTFADRGKAWTPTALKPGPQNLRALTELMGRLGAKGGTNLCDGLVQALQLEGVKYGGTVAPKIDELFVLSDGEPTAGPLRETADLLQLVREANKYAQVRIHCVFTGTGGGADLMRQLAEQNGGVFVQR